MDQAILRLPAVQAKAGLSRSTIYLRISEGLWPKPVKLGARSIGWPANEINTLINARIAAQTDDQIRQLVQTLEANRVMNFS